MGTTEVAGGFASSGACGCCKKGWTMRILIAGASGLIDSAIAPHLASQGHKAVRLVRRALSTGKVQWDPDARTIPL